METFSNPQVYWEDIPKHQQTELRKVEPAYLKVMVANRIFFWVILAVLAGLAWFFLSQQSAGSWLGIAGALFIAVGLGFGLFTAQKAFQNMGYAVRKHDVIFKKGWLFEKLHVVPLKRIQHCVVKRGPLDQYFGLATLKIFTAGGNAADITIRGLRYEDAQTLKDFLGQNEPQTSPNNQIEEDATLG